MGLTTEEMYEKNFYINYFSDLIIKMRSNKKYIHDLYEEEEELMNSYQLTLKEIQLASLEVLKRVTDICEKENLRYYLAYGTLIGAIRHKGFIPWDDDIDIVMPRPDYDQLLKYMENNKNKLGHLQLFTHKNNKSYPYAIARVSDNRYRIKMDNEKYYGLGVFIDIYPMDGLGNNKRKAGRLCVKGQLLSSFCYQATRQRFAVEITKGKLKRFLKIFVYILAKCVGKEYFQNKLEKLGDLGSYDESKYVGCVVWNSCGAEIVQKRQWFDEYLMLPFDKYEFRAPKGYDEILKLFYGDYMEFPPENERIPHHFYKMYKK